MLIYARVIPCSDRVDHGVDGRLQWTRRQPDANRTPSPSPDRDRNRLHPAWRRLAGRLAFGDEPIVIYKGERLRWVNADTLTHLVVADSPDATDFRKTEELPGTAANNVRHDQAGDDQNPLCHSPEYDWHPDCPRTVATCGRIDETDRRKKQTASPSIHRGMAISSQKWGQPS